MKRTPFFFSDGNPMAERHKAFRWDETPLGPPDTWDAALKTLVPVMLVSSQPMFIAWGPSRTLLYNDGYAQILVDRHPAALGRDLLDVWPEIRDAIEPIVQAAYRGEPSQMDDLELWVERRGYREETHFSFFYAPVRDASGGVAGVFCGCNEITAQIFADRRVAESESRHRGVLENMGEGFILFDRDFTILEVNDATIRLIGLPRDELLGWNHWDRFPGADDAPVGRLYRQVLAERRPGMVENRHRYPDGREQWYEVHAFPVGEGLAAVFQDVTHRKRLQEQATRSLERVQLALDAGAIVGTWVWNIPDDRVVPDEQLAKSMGLDSAQLAAGISIKAVFEAMHPGDRGRVQEAVAQAVKSRGQYRCQYRVRRDGVYRWVEACGQVQVDAEGTPARLPGVLLDIDDRRRIEAERDHAATLLRTFIEAVPGVVYAKDREGRMLVANRGTAELLGRPPEEFIGLTDAELLADPEQAAAIMDRDRQIMASGIAQQAEEAVQRADGTPAIWWSSKEPLRDADGEVVGLVGTSVDITERKQIEEALRLSEQRSAMAIEVARLGTWRWDIRTGAVSVDDRCRQMCGLDPTADAFQLGHLQQRIHPEDWPAVEQALLRALEPGGSHHYDEEFRWVHPDGVVVWTASRGTVRFVEEGGRQTPVALLGSVIDITERRQMIQALREADRRKDEFLAMLAHELRNPLAPISTASHILKLTAGDPKRVRDASEIISRQVGHLTRLVDDLLDVSRVTRGLVELEQEPVDLCKVVSTAVEQAKPLVQSRCHELRTRTGAGPFVVTGDFHRLVQVVSNLLNNAAKYTPQGGVIDVELGVEDGQAVLGVGDNGLGIAPDMTERVFDMFTQAERTPDRSQGGLGIGLALVRSLVQLHGGEVRAESAGLHQGSRFRVALPLQAVTCPTTPEPRARVAKARLRILVVDDNVDAAATLSEVLQLLGHSVETAYDAGQALVKAADGPPWDAFILDIGLPDMTGYELAGRLRGLPSARHAMFVALTGYGQAHDRVTSSASGFDCHLVKPANITQLLDILAGIGEPA